MNTVLHILIALVAIEAILVMLSWWMGRGQVGQVQHEAAQSEFAPVRILAGQRASRQTLITGRRAVKVTRAAWKAAPSCRGGSPQRPTAGGSVTATGKTPGVRP